MSRDPNEVLIEQGEEDKRTLPDAPVIHIGSKESCEKCWYLRWIGPHSDSKVSVCGLSDEEVCLNNFCDNFIPASGIAKRGKQWCDEHQSYSCTHD